MPLLVDLIYGVAALLTLPVWLFRMWQTGKIRTDWAGRLGRTLPLPPKLRPRLLIHAVSVGEVNAIRTLVDALSQTEAAPEIVIAATTDTGFARASTLWSARHRVVRYPFDFSFSVRSFLTSVKPDAVALVELEVWPNFTAICNRRRIPVCVINGRLSARSFRRYRRVAGLLRSTFARLAVVGAQNDAYADRFRALGVPAEKVVVTGTMKWDAAQIADTVSGADELAAALGIDRSRPLIVAGSTAPDEHALLMAAVPRGVQLLCAPRKPEWFDAAAATLTGCARRSKGERGSSTGRFLLDSIGELRQAYSLADLVVVGRTFGDLHGSDMMEPVALGKATIVGPAVSDFQDTVDALLNGDGIIQCTRDGLGSTIQSLLDDPKRRARLASNGRVVIAANQGATARTEKLVRSLLPSVV